MAQNEFVLVSRPAEFVRSSKRFWFRFLENFFRRWMLFIVPALLVIAVGGYQASKVPSTFRASGSLNIADNPLLHDITSARGSDIVNFETPSQATARTINEMLGTDNFIDDVAKRAGFVGVPDLVTRVKIRSNVYAAATGNRLLSVSASWEDANTSFQLAQAVIARYKDSVLASQIADSTQAATFWGDLAARYKDEVAKAEGVLEAWVQAHPAPTNGIARTTEDQLHLGRYNADIQRYTDQETNAQNKVEEANLLTGQSKSQVGERLQVVDAPTLPTSPESIRIKQAIIVVIYFALALVIVGAFTMTSTLLDRTVRSAEDVKMSGGLDVVATVPLVAALGRKKGRGSKKSGSRAKSLAPA